MLIREQVSLADYSTMRLGGKAAYLTDATKPDDIVAAVDWAEKRRLSVIAIGIGSNIVWRDDGFDGLVIVNKIRGFERHNDEDDHLVVTVGAGEDWDSVVKRTVDMGFSGIEQLSLIPGTAGATPVQNVGAYGREIADVLISLEAYDVSQHKFVTLSPEDCAFAYRTSRFKTTDRGRFIITSITFGLTRTDPGPPFYPALQSYFTEHGITRVTPQTLRDAVIAVRTSKLPDPAKVANNGSFFGNPIIDKAQFDKLIKQFPKLTYWPLPNDRYKLAAGWLVEQCGLRGYHDPETGMATWDKQALVLVNESARSTRDLLKFKQKIVKAVEDKFGVTLDQEPELI